LWVDSETNLMWIGDVGETTREEISVGSGNQHYGYPFREGTENYEGDTGRGADGSIQNMHCMTMSPGRECTGPVYDYARTNTTNCVIGGLIPSGCGWDNAFGGSTYYLFADHGAGWVRALTVSADRRGIMGTTAMDFGTFQGSQPRSFRMGPDDSMYLVVNSGVYKFTPNDRTGAECMGGTGGMGGMAGMAGMGGGASGSSGEGGSTTGGSSSGGSSGAATTGGQGGSNATGGSGVTGGMGVTGGAGNAGGAAGAGTAGGGGSDDDDGGCGCRTTGHAARPFALALLGLGLAFAFGRRRARR
jgi:MYXO-CTERM domain-containing protein